MSYSNQKIVRIGNREKRDAQHIYSTMNIEAMQEAMMELRGETFKLWCYLNKNQEGYQFELSQKECEKWGIKKDVYYAAVKKLVELGYLVPIEEGSNIYVFFELRHSEIQKFSEIQKNAEIEETKTKEEPRRLEETSISHWDKDNPNVIGEIDNEKDLIAYLEILFRGQLTSKVKYQLQEYLKVIPAKGIARFYFYCDQKENWKIRKGSEMTLGLLQYKDIKERANSYWTTLENKKKIISKEIMNTSEKVISVKLPPRKEKKLTFTKEEIEAMV